MGGKLKKHYLIIEIEETYTPADSEEQKEYQKTIRQVLSGIQRDALARKTTYLGKSVIMRTRRNLQEDVT